MNQNYYFMAGLPRAGSTLLKSIIDQNPNVHTEPVSPVMELMYHTEEYFKQITAERQILKTNRSGFQMPQWVKKAGVRNECLDTWVYSYAAMCLYISKFNRNTVWEQLENKINKPDDVVKQKKGTIRTSRKNDFVTNW